jgi:DNA-binding CsgD family transcriptional regulator
LWGVTTPKWKKQYYFPVNVDGSADSFEVVPMISVQKFSELLFSVQGAVANPHEWEHFLGQLSWATSAPTAFVIFRDPQKGINQVSFHGGIHTAAEREELYARSKQIYAECYGAQDPYHVALMRSGLAGAVPGEALVEPRALRMSEMYNELLSPLGFDYLCLLPINFRKDVHHQLCIWRDSAGGTFDQEEREWLQLLEPHLRMALLLQQTFQSKDAQLAKSEVLMNLTNNAAFLLDRSLRLVHMNSSAEEMLRTGDTFRLAGGRLEVRDAFSQKRLRDLLLKVVSKQSIELSDPGGIVPLTILKPRPHDMYALVAPVAIASGNHIASPHILILISGADDRAASVNPLMRRLWGCTEAECAIANLLLESHDILEMSEKRQVSIGTVRNQVKSLLAKTGTHRQSDLVRLLMSLPRLTNIP